MIGIEIRNAVFRDTTKFYETMPSDVIVARQLVRFVRRYSGKNILDYGCAIGNYCLYFQKEGYKTTGVDTNEKYVEIARKRGVEAYLVTGPAPFPDKSFDTVIIFEVLEHLENPAPLLQDAKRLARKNILITTPNCERIEELRSEGLLFEHFADMDHKNFFMPSSLDSLLAKHFTSVEVKKGNGINPFALVSFAPLRLIGKVLVYLHLIKPKFYFRLFAIAKP